MGRYYECASGKFGGKFWFGVQPSDDPETVFGMREVDTDGNSYSDYETDEMDKVRREIHKQFDILKVPKEKRELKFLSRGEIGTYVWDELQDYYMTENREEGVDRPYYNGEGKPSIYPRSHELELAAARVDLGLNILNEMREDKNGVCLINAEW